MEDSPDWGQLVKDCLGSAFIGTIATNGSDGPRATTIYFSCDGNFNVYFMSDQSAKHMKDIAKDNRVGFAMFTPPENSKSAKIGLQIEGTAESADINDIDIAYKSRTKKIAASDMWILKENIGEFVKGKLGTEKIIKIAPKTLYYFNTRYLGNRSHKLSIDELI